MSEYDYEVPLRPNFEARQAVGWGMGGAVTLLAAAALDVPSQAFLTMAGIQGGLAFCRSLGAWRHYRRLSALCDDSLTFISMSELQEKTDIEGRYLGEGYLMRQEHAQLVHEINRKDLLQYVPRRKRRKSKTDHGDEVSTAYLQGIEKNITARYMRMAFAKGHTLIAGTTGAGKTRLLELLIAQDIMRRDANGNFAPVIVIDPKGDRELPETMRRACAAVGREKDFRYFHFSHPLDSVRIDALANFQNPSDLASRIAALIPSNSNDSFRAFCHMALNNVVQGIVLTEKRVTLKLIAQYLSGDDLAVLTVKCLETYISSPIPDYKMTLDSALKKAGGVASKKYPVLWDFYKERLREKYGNTELENLCGQYEHDHAHFQKMIASLKPLLTILTSDQAGELLSPQSSKLDDEREIITTEKIIQNNGVLYVGLATLGNTEAGQALGSLLLSDLAAVAGAIYDHEPNPDARKKHLYVDETSEVINMPLIQLLNKTRGAGFVCNIATQTIPDIIAGYGNKDLAYQVLGNINNFLVLRIKDQETIEYFANKLPLTKIKYIMHTQGNNSQASTIEFGGNIGERLMEEEQPFVPATILATLPDLHMLYLGAEGHVTKVQIPILTTQGDE
ncbi:MAG: conjugative transfer system coupling protein TraD [Porticoccaceae bacterium]